MEIKLGNSPESWGIMQAEDPNQISWDAYLDELQKAGYGWSELGPYGYLPTTIPVLKNELSKRNINITAAGILVPLQEKAIPDNVLEDINKYCILLNEIGSTFLNLVASFYDNPNSKFTDPPNKSNQALWNNIFHNLNTIGEYTLTKFNIHSQFHPCAGTFIESENEILNVLTNTNPQFISLCLDTAHHAYCGGNPISFLKSHHSRIKYIHIKNIDLEIFHEVKKNNLSWFEAVRRNIISEPNSGIIDYRKLLKELKKISFDGFAIVEHDIYNPTQTLPFKIAKKTRDYLKQINFE